VVQRQRRRHRCGTCNNTLIASQVDCGDRTQVAKLPIDIDVQQVGAALSMQHY
jgi:hypothetical protein